MILSKFYKWHFWFKIDRTALSIASTDGNYEIVKLLLSQKNIDINVKSIYGIINIKFCFTPLHYAAQNGYTDIVSLLLNDKKMDYEQTFQHGYI